MTDLKDAPSQAPVDERLRFHLRKDQPNQLFGSTVGYCEGAIDLSLEKFQAKIEERTGPSEHVQAELKTLKESRWNLPPGIGIVDEGNLFFRLPNGRMTAPTTLIKAAYAAEPRLLQMHEVLVSLPPFRNGDTTVRYPGFNSRLKSIVTNAEIEVDSPIVQIMGATFMTQIARYEARAEASALAKKAAMFGGLESLENFPAFKEKIADSVRKIRMEEAYINLGAKTIERIATEQGLGEEEVRLLQDICFMRSNEISNADEFREIVIPIVKLCAEGNWEEAKKHRDFLFTAFYKIFPDWRQVELGAGSQSFKSLKDLQKAIAEGRFLIALDEIPDYYKELLGLAIPDSRSRELRSADRSIVARSVDLSNAFLSEFRLEANMKNVRWSAKNMNFSDPEKIIQIFFTLPYPQQVEAYYDLVEQEFPDMPSKKAEASLGEFRRLRHGIGVYGISDEYAYYLEGKQYTHPGTEDEFVDEVNMFRMLNSEKRKTRRVQDRLRFEEFGLNLSRKISNNSPEEIVRILHNAYRKYTEKNPGVDYSLRDYVEIMLTVSGIDTNKDRYKAVLTNL